jgi:hypothetical protein
MEYIQKFLAELADFYVTQGWFQLTGLALFGVLGFGGERLPIYLFFYGDKEKARKYDHQIYGFQGFCCFFFWVVVIVNGPLAVLGVGYKIWEVLSRRL